MLSISVIKDPHYCEKAVDKKLAAEKDGVRGNKAIDYYEEGGEPAGRWGKGAELLGLEGVVKRDQIDELAKGFVNGKALGQNSGKDNMKIGHDLTFSAPKSVSAIWAVASPELQAQISAAQQRAVENAMEFMRENSITRRGSGACSPEDRTVETPKALIYATYEHHDSRAGQPQLHTHVMTSNFVIREDGQTSALDGKSLFDAKMACGATYRASLAQEMRNLGFATEMDEKNKGCFQIKGVPEDLCTKWSERSATIKKAAAEGMTVKNQDGSTSLIKGVSAKAKAMMTLATRQKKVVGKRLQHFLDWKGEANKDFNFNEKTVEDLKSLESTQYERPSHETMLKELTENESHFTRLDAERLIAEQAQYGEMDRAEALENLLNSEDCERVIVKGKLAYTSKTLQMTDRAIVRDAKLAQQNFSHRLSDNTLNKVFDNAKERGMEYRPQQMEAIKYGLQDSTALGIIQGKAGSGKSTILNAVREGYEMEGFKLRGCAISAKAAEVLGRESGIESTTIAGLVKGLNFGKIQLTNKDVLIVDEAGMVGSRDMRALQKACMDSGAKLLLVGDTQQLQAVSSGGAMKMIMDQAKVQAADLGKGYRAKNATQGQDNLTKEQQKAIAHEMVEASEELSLGQSKEAIARYEKLGAIKVENSHQKAISAIAEAYLNDKNSLDQKSIIVATRDEAMIVSEMVREGLVKQGVVDTSKEASLKNMDGVVLKVGRGDRILFKENDNSIGVKNNVQAEVQRVKEISHEGEKGYEITAKTNEGKTVSFNTIDTKGGKGYTNLRLAYATTGHSQQGETITSTHVLFSNGRMNNKHWGYVAATRHRDDFKLYMGEENRDALEERFATEGLKDSTYDYQKANASVIEADKVKLREKTTNSQNAFGDATKRLGTIATQAETAIESTQQQIENQAKIDSVKLDNFGKTGISINTPTPSLGGVSGGIQIGLSK